jgi:hypothetical protein
MEGNVIPLNINFKDNTGEVVLIPIDFWVDMLKSGKNFNWVKVNHGIFDIIARIPNVGQLSPREIATKMVPLRHPNNRQVPTEKYVNIIDKFISNVRNYDELPSNYFIGVSDSNGLNIPPDRNRHSAIMNIINPNSKRTLLHGGLIRRYVVSGDIHKLLNTVKEEGYRIHVIGPNHCTHYQKVLGSFNHINIPKVGALGMLDQIADVARQTLTGKDIFFTSLTTGTFLFLDKFKEKNVTVIDVGRAFDYLIKEHRSVHDQPWLTPLPPNSPRYQTRVKFYKDFVDNGYDQDLIKYKIKQTNNF